MRIICVIHEIYAKILFRILKLVEIVIKHICQLSTFSMYDKSEHRLLIIGVDGFVGDNIVQCARSKAQKERFLFVLNSRVGSLYSPWQPICGYYHGKERAEAVVRKRFPGTGIALLPGFIYGWRRTKR
ncbi:hypothetical protein Plhal304r1_c023g0080341 [Plasmopara halstedii]